MPIEPMSLAEMMPWIFGAFVALAGLAIQYSRDRTRIIKERAELELRMEKQNAKHQADLQSMNAELHKKIYDMTIKHQTAISNEYRRYRDLEIRLQKVENQHRKDVEELEGTIKILVVEVQKYDPEFTLGDIA